MVLAVPEFFEAGCRTGTSDLKTRLTSAFGSLEELATEATPDELIYERDDVRLDDELLSSAYFGTWANISCIDAEDSRINCFENSDRMKVLDGLIEIRRILMILKTIDEDGVEQPMLWLASPDSEFYGNCIRKAARLLMRCNDVMLACQFLHVLQATLSLVTLRMDKSRNWVDVEALDQFRIWLKRYFTISFNWFIDTVRRKMLLTVRRLADVSCKVQDEWLNSVFAVAKIICRAVYGVPEGLSLLDLMKRDVLIRGFVRSNLYIQMLCDLTSPRFAYSFVVGDLSVEKKALNLASDEGAVGGELQTGSVKVTYNFEVAGIEDALLFWHYWDLTAPCLSLGWENAFISVFLRATKYAWAAGRLEEFMQKLNNTQCPGSDEDLSVLKAIVTRICVVLGRVCLQLPVLSSSSQVGPLTGFLNSERVSPDVSGLFKSATLSSVTCVIADILVLLLTPKVLNLFDNMIWSLVENIITILQPYSMPSVSSSRDKEIGEFLSQLVSSYLQRVVVERTVHGKSMFKQSEWLDKPEIKQSAQTLPADSDESTPNESNFRNMRLGPLEDGTIVSLCRGMAENGVFKKTQSASKYESVLAFLSVLDPENLTRWMHEQWTSVNETTDEPFAAVTVLRLISRCSRIITLYNPALMLDVVELGWTDDLMINHVKMITVISCLLAFSTFASTIDSTDYASTAEQRQAVLDAQSVKLGLFGARNSDNDTEFTASYDVGCKISVIPRVTHMDSDKIYNRVPYCQHINIRNYPETRLRDYLKEGEIIIDGERVGSSYITRHGSLAPNVSTAAGSEETPMLSYQSPEEFAALIETRFSVTRIMKRMRPELFDRLLKIVDAFGKNDVGNTNLGNTIQTTLYNMFLGIPKDEAEDLNREFWRWAIQKSDAPQKLVKLLASGLTSATYRCDNVGLALKQIKLKLIDESSQKLRGSNSAIIWSTTLLREVIMIAGRECVVEHSQEIVELSILLARHSTFTVFKMATKLLVAYSTRVFESDVGAVSLVDRGETRLDTTLGWGEPLRFLLSARQARNVPLDWMPWDLPTRQQIDWGIAVGIVLLHILSVQAKELTAVTLPSVARYVECIKDPQVLEKCQQWVLMDPKAEKEEDSTKQRRSETTLRAIRLLNCFIKCVGAVWPDEKDSRKIPFSYEELWRPIAPLPPLGDMLLEDTIKFIESMSALCDEGNGGPKKITLTPILKEGVTVGAANGGAVPPVEGLDAGALVGAPKPESADDSFDEMKEAVKDGADSAAAGVGASSSEGNGEGGGAQDELYKVLTQLVNICDKVMLKRSRAMRGLDVAKNVEMWLTYGQWGYPLLKLDPCGQVTCQNWVERVQQGWLYRSSSSCDLAGLSEGRRAILRFLMKQTRSIYNGVRAVSQKLVMKLVQTHMGCATVVMEDLMPTWLDCCERAIHDEEAREDYRMKRELTGLIYLLVESRITRLVVSERRWRHKFVMSLVEMLEITFDAVKLNRRLGDLSYGFTDMRLTLPIGAAAGGGASGTGIRIEDQIKLGSELLTKLDSLTKSKSQAFTLSMIIQTVIPAIIVKHPDYAVRVADKYMEFLTAKKSEVTVTCQSLALWGMILLLKTAQTIDRKNPSDPLLPKIWSAERTSQLLNVMPAFFVQLSSGMMGPNTAHDVSHMLLIEMVKFNISWPPTLLSRFHANFSVHCALAAQTCIRAMYKVVGPEKFEAEMQTHVKPLADLWAKENSAHSADEEYYSALAHLIAGTMRACRKLDEPILIAVSEMFTKPFNLTTQSVNGDSSMWVDAIRFVLCGLVSGCKMRRTASNDGVGCDSLDLSALLDSRNFPHPELIWNIVVNLWVFQVASGAPPASIPPPDAAGEGGSREYGRKLSVAAHVYFDSMGLMPLAADWCKRVIRDDIGVLDHENLKVRDAYAHLVAQAMVCEAAAVPRRLRRETAGTASISTGNVCAADYPLISFIVELMTEKLNATEAALRVYEDTWKSDPPSQEVKQFLSLCSVLQLVFSHPARAALWPLARPWLALALVARGILEPGVSAVGKGFTNNLFSSPTLPFNTGMASSLEAHLRQAFRQGQAEVRRRDLLRLGDLFLARFAIGANGRGAFQRVKLAVENEVVLPALAQPATSEAATQSYSLLCSLCAQRQRECIARRLLEQLPTDHPADVGYEHQGQLIAISTLVASNARIVYWLPGVLATYARFANQRAPDRCRRIVETCLQEFFQRYATHWHTQHKHKFTPAQLDLLQQYRGRPVYFG